MFRLIGVLVLFAVTAGGYMYFDYRMSARWAGKADADGLTFTDYLSSLPARLSNLAGSASGSGMPTKLADMLPTAPKGWTVRAVDPKDVEGFLPKSGKTADAAGVAAVKAMAEASAESGTETAVLAFEKGDRKLIVKAVRYPNTIFTSSAAMQQRIELQKMGAQFRGTEFATVRGLDVTEDLMPEGFRGRMFLADVGAQIHLRILAPKRMSDAELVPFLETLHVKAMNASVVDKVDGLGDVPVIVLVSKLDGAERDAYLADVAARAASETAGQAAEAAELAAAAPAEAPKEGGGGFLAKLFGGGEAAAEDAAPKADAPPAIGCETGSNGVKRCTITSAPAGG